MSIFLTRMTKMCNEYLKEIHCNYIYIYIFFFCIIRKNTKGFIDKYKANVHDLLKLHQIRKSTRCGSENLQIVQEHPLVFLNLPQFRAVTRTRGLFLFKYHNEIKIFCRHLPIIDLILFEIEWREVSYCLLYLFRKNSTFRPTFVAHQAPDVLRM